MSGKPPSVVVLVSAGRHPVSGAPRACRGDAVAMALGKKLAGDSLRVVHAGLSSDLALLDYMALGAHRIEVMKADGGEDIVASLAAHVRDADIILTGSRAEVGAGSGLVPYLLASRLSRPMIADVLDIRIAGDEFYLQQFLPKGKRRSIAATAPLVISVHALAPVALNYAHARRVTGQVVSIAAAENGPLSSEARNTIPNVPAWTVDPSARRANVLRAADHKDGHARMLSYIQSPVKAGAVVFEGSPVDKAQILLTYLRDHRLVDF